MLPPDDAMTDGPETGTGFCTPQPGEFLAVRPPGAGGILLFTAGFLFFQFFLQAIGLIVHWALPFLPVEHIEILIMFSATLLWGLAAWFWVVVRRLPREWISLRPPKVRRWFWPVLLISIPVVLQFGGAIDMFVLSFFPQWVRPDPTLERLTDTSAGSPWMQVMTFLLAVAAAPLCEELFFRGVTLRSLIFRKWSALAAALFTSVLFAGIHFKITGFFLLFTVAMVLSMLAIVTKSLLAPVAFHAGYNAFVLIVSLWQRARPVMEPFSMQPAPEAAIALPSRAEILTSFFATLPFFATLVALLYFGAFPKKEEP